MNNSNSSRNSNQQQQPATATAASPLSYDSSPFEIVTYVRILSFLFYSGLLNALKDYPVVSCFLETVWNVDKIGDGDDDETDGKSKNKEEGGKDEASSYTEYLKR